MARSGGRVVGDYLVGRQIGAGSFSVVWHGRHRVDGTDVAIKEIAMEKLNKKLRESLMSEIVILQRIDHPNIIRLHRMIEISGRVYLVLEYCKGGDLSVYIQRHGAVAEATAKYFMQQLAAGLKVLREHNLIHRDLKPQNLLLLTNDDHSVLKIADFGFARSLQPRGLAETLCGSPLYMAPEIMHLQKYDAKADLWSVGAILYQLVTGKTPFTGNNQIQLLQNIMKSAEISFPPGKSYLSFYCLDLCQSLLRRNPVERLTFEEFFNHTFLASKALDKSLIREHEEASGRIFSVQSDIFVEANESLHEDCLPFTFDDDHNTTDVEPLSPSPTSRLPLKQVFGKATSNGSSCMKISCQEAIVQGAVKSFTHDFHYSSSDVPFRNIDTSDGPRETKFTKGLDSLEWIDQDYVIVSSPPFEEKSSSVSATRPRHLASKSGNLLRTSINNPKSSLPMPIKGALPRRANEFGSTGSSNSAPPGASHGSIDMREVLEQPSSGCISSKIKSLQFSASAISELVSEKAGTGKFLEAFSIQLVLLAIWKQALNICHTDAASAVDGSPFINSPATRSIFSSSSSSSNLEVQGQATVLSQIEREFLQQVGYAEELANDLELSTGNTEMPDALELIFQSALASGRYGGVQELMGTMENAMALYTKAVRLLSFLMDEAPSLVLNPPLSLTTSDRFRLKSYIDILNDRQNRSRLQRIALLKCEDPPNLSP